jgi:hypothetical protein
MTETDCTEYTESELFNRICGIDPSCVENSKKYESLINDMKCPICLKIVCKPLECVLCETLICEDCKFILNLAEQSCVTPNCKGQYEKANKFIREILTALKIKCFACNEKNLNYTNYLKHIEECEQYKKNPPMAMIREINKNSEIIKKLKKEYESLVNTNMNNISPDELRLNMVTSKLSISEKMDLYNAAVEGRVPDFKKLVEVNNFPILEEVSAKSYGWTPFHYAMHYGKWEIIKYIMNYLNARHQLNLALMLKSSDGRCPLLCLLRSNTVNIEKKKEIFGNILNEFKNINISDEVKKELKNRGLSYMIDGRK